MKYLDEFRDPLVAKGILKEIHNSAKDITGTVRIMEICGSHTVSIFRAGIKSLLPENIKLISGPGCPVCVTSMEDMDRMIAIADRGRDESVIIATFGDMIRVPGTQTSLEKAKASGADVRIVDSPLESIRWAKENPDRPVVFLGVGFETTSPTIAASVQMAMKGGLDNYFVYPAFKLLPPALVALLEADDIAIDGFLCPGHVSVMLGAAAYRPAAEKYGKPCAIAGFEPLDVLLGISRLCSQFADKLHEVDNAYGRAVTEEGNQTAMDLLNTVFEPVDTPWRGLGTIPLSGLAFSEEYNSFDAKKRFDLESVATGSDPSECACGEVLRGVMDPPECPLFDNGCNPEMPIGSCMVSSEGSCAAWYRYGRDQL